MKDYVDGTIFKFLVYKMSQKILSLEYQNFSSTLETLFHQQFGFTAAESSGNAKCRIVYHGFSHHKILFVLSFAAIFINTIRLGGIIFNTKVEQFEEWRVYLTSCALRYTKFNRSL